MYLVGRVTKHGASLARVASHGKKPKTLEARGILPAGGKRLARLAESGYHYSPLIESSPPGDSSLWFFSATRSGSDTYGRGVSQRLENLLGGSAGGRELAPETVRFAAPLCGAPPPVGLDRHLRGLSGSSPRSVLIKICASKKIGEERRGDYPEAGINLEYKGKTNLK